MERKQLSVSYFDGGKESDPYDLFVYAINAEQTREKYVTRMKKFLEIIGIDKEKKLSIRERCVIFSEKARSEDGWLMNVIIQFLQYQKRRVSHREITASTLRNYVKVLKLFCEMNDLLVPWKKLTRGLPRAKNYADDRVPRLDEIQKILTYPDWRIKAIVCTMASSGIRLGAWDFLFWEHITPIARDGKLIAAKIVVYAGDREQYHSFLTPEAYWELQNWMDFRKDSGEKISGKSWVMRDLWNTRYCSRRHGVPGLVNNPVTFKILWHKEVNGRCTLVTGNPKEVGTWKKKARVSDRSLLQKVV